MTFATISPGRPGRPRLLNRVVARPVGKDQRYISLVIATDLGDRLIAKYPSDASQIEIMLGVGEDHGKILLRVSANQTGCFVCRNPTNYRINLRTVAINRRAPESTTILPHEWRGDALVVDLTPLSEF